MRARSVMGAFGGTGSYATSASGNREVGFEEDLFGALRLGSHFQVGLWAPFVQTSRQAGGLSGWGGGLGDVAANVRFDAVNAGDARRLAGGRDAGGALGPDRPAARRSGRPAGDVGHRNRIVRRQRSGSRSRRSSATAFVSLAGWVSQRSARTVDGVEQSFAPRLSALAVGRIHVRARHHRRRVRVLAASGRRPRRGGADREQRRRAGDRRRRARAAVLADVAPADDAVHRRADRPAGGAIRRSASAAPWRSSASGSDPPAARYGYLIITFQRRLRGFCSPSGGLSSSTFHTTNDVI